MPTPILISGDCRQWDTDIATGQWTCTAVADLPPETTWTLDPAALGQAFGAGLILTGPIIAVLIAGYSILRALRNRRG